MNNFPGVANKTCGGLSAGLRLFAEIARGFNMATSACWPDSYRWLKGVTAGETAQISDRVRERYENFDLRIAGRIGHRSAAFASESGYLLPAG
jgi:hypothetical protein